MTIAYTALRPGELKKITHDGSNFSQTGGMVNTKINNNNKI